jgi:hypothetical protein
MMGRIPRPDLKKRFLCTICEAGTCELIVENYDKAPTFCPFDKEFGSYKWEEIPEGAKNTEQQLQPENGKYPCADKGCAGWDNGFCADPCNCRDHAVSG